MGERPDMRKRLQLSMLTATTALATSFTLVTTLAAPQVWAAEGDNSARGITTEEEHGRKIYVNEDAPARQRQPQAAPARRSTLVYWSSKDNRWKPVPGAGTASMQAARSAAAEVSQFFGHDTAQSANAKIVAA